MGLSTTEFKILTALRNQLRVFSAIEHIETKEDAL